MVIMIEENSIFRNLTFLNNNGGVASGAFQV